MDEQEFDALFSSRSFGTQDAKREDARWRRCATLGALLFGRTPEDLRRQLLASRPEIPSGYHLTDFHDLQEHMEMVNSALSNPRNIWLSPLMGTSAFGLIEVGTQRLSTWEARLEIVRRAIDYLENR
ncbi:MAG TPA: hypothetical protein VKB90_16525 [Candidatus Acidoferrum sp.]|nr:hypothetical protein [Candidatus Acidoferrum sp.]